MNFAERFKGKTSKVTKEGLNAVMHETPSSKLSTNGLNSNNFSSNQKIFEKKAYSEIIPTRYEKVEHIKVKTSNII